MSIGVKWGKCVDGIYLQEDRALGSSFSRDLQKIGRGSLLRTSFFAGVDISVLRQNLEEDLKHLMRKV